MKLPFFLAIFLLITTTDAKSQLKKIAVLGSSTAAGTGASSPDSSWVRKFSYYYKYQNSVLDTVYNLAVGGYDPYKGLPSSYICAPYYSLPDPDKNITKANSFSPDVIIVSFVSNLYNTGGLPMDSILHSLQVIKDSANKAGSICFITTSQPRSSFDGPSREKLKLVRDSIINRFGFYAINFYDSLVNPIDNTILPQFSAGDGIHLNNAGHAMLFRQVVAKKIFNITTTSTRRSGNFNDPLVWDKGIVPGAQDSIAIVPGHTLTLAESITIKALSIKEGGTLTLNNEGARLQVGQAVQSNHEVVINGALNINNGRMIIFGNLVQKAGSSFTMSSGSLVIDGNNGDEVSSVENGKNLFEINQDAQFNFSGGQLQITDPPLGETSQAISCPFNFGPNSILKLGNGVSTKASNNPNGFGGDLLPPVIGKLIIDAATSNNNRIFKNLNPLTVTKTLEVFSGNLVPAAIINLVN